MIGWLVSIVAGIDWWLWIALAACAAVIVGLWLVPVLPTGTRVAGSIMIVVAVAFGLLLNAWQVTIARADVAEATVAAEQELRKSAERELREERQTAAERAADEQAIETLGKDMSDAIDKAAARAPGAAPGPATLALGCARLRAAGLTASANYQRQCR